MSGVTFSLLLFAAFITMPKGSNGAYKMESYDAGNYKVMWKYDMIKDVFKFNITVKATGWVGFGVSKNVGGMVGYDVMVGGVQNMNETYGMVSHLSLRLC